MAFKTTSMNKEPRPNENDPRGEIRIDDRGNKSWHTFKKKSQPVSDIDESQVKTSSKRLKK